MGRRPEQTFLRRGHTDGQQAHEKMFNITSYQRNANQNYNEISPHTSQNGYHQTIHKKTNAGEGVKRREPSSTVGGNVNWYSHYVKQYGGCKQTKLNIELPYDPASPLLGIYPEKNMAGNDTFTSLFIAPLFTIAKTWKQPKCPLTEEWIRKMRYRYTMEYYSAIKRMKSGHLQQHGWTQRVSY